MRQVAAIILAAGEAKRFRGSATETKLVAELEGKRIVRHVAEAALASRARPVLLVTGHAHGQVLRALDGLLLERIHNRDPGAGLAVSLKLAIAALPDTARGAVILLGDMPRETASARGAGFLNCRRATPRLRSISTHGRICACFKVFDRHETELQHWRNFLRAHGSRKLPAQLCINVTRIEWTSQKNRSWQ